MPAGDGGLKVARRRREANEKEFMVYVREAVESLGPSASIGSIHDEVRRRVPYAVIVVEIERWMRTAIRGVLRSKVQGVPLRASVGGEYHDPQQLTFAEFEEWARSQARRGKEHFAKVYEIAALCYERTSVELDAEAIIAEAMGGAA
jgi:hypothetical protein